MVGYVRVSTLDQHPESQTDALRAAGCERIFTDHGISGTKVSRPQLAACLDYVRVGDTLVVWKLDRLGRSLPHLLTTVQELGEKGIEFRSLTEQLDTTTAAGRLIFSVVGAFAAFERDIIAERTRAGLAHARSQGRTGGRPTVMSPEKLEAARRLRTDEGMSIRDIAAALDVGASTVQRALTAVGSSA